MMAWMIFFGSARNRDGVGLEACAGRSATGRFRIRTRRPSSPKAWKKRRSPNLLAGVCWTILGEGNISGRIGGAQKMETGVDWNSNPEPTP
jgi:hypothetical protein